MEMIEDLGFDFRDTELNKKIREMLSERKVQVLNWMREDDIMWM